MGEEKGGTKVIQDHGEESKKGLPRALKKETAIKALDRSQLSVVLKRTMSWS